MHSPDTHIKIKETFLTLPRQPSYTIHTLLRHHRLQVEYIFNKKNLYGGWVGPSGNDTTLWLHLASWNLPDSQLS